MFVSYQIALAAVNTVILLRTSFEIYLGSDADDFQARPGLTDSLAKWTGGLICDLDAEPLARYRKGEYHQQIWEIH